MTSGSAYECCYGAAVWPACLPACPLAVTLCVLPKTDAILMKRCKTRVLNELVSHTAFEFITFSTTLRNTATQLCQVNGRELTTAKASLTR